MTGAQWLEAAGRIAGMEKAGLRLRRALARVPVVPVAVAGYVILILVAGFYFRMSLTPIA